MSTCVSMCVCNVCCYHNMLILNLPSDTTNIHVCKETCGITHNSNIHIQYMYVMCISLTTPITDM